MKKYGIAIGAVLLIGLVILGVKHKMGQTDAEVAAQEIQQNKVTPEK